jgi:hypothetical protein
LRRLSEMQVGMPYELRIVAVIPNAPLVLETALHRIFLPIHIRGEWFQPDPVLWRYIRELATLWVPDGISGDSRLSEDDRSRRLAEIVDQYRKGSASWVLGTECERFRTMAEKAGYFSSM